MEADQQRSQAKETPQQPGKSNEIYISGSDKISIYTTGTHSKTYTVKCGPHRKQANGAIKLFL